ncbi:DUF2489 domain-containing protein [Paraferrimonas sp. SM1919]|uniref:DUF2489 domain-containing protein n=1 Tax=Paraferrimonas sp. SM1919 TaxID=2662263 RepID=UPI0013D387C2|nr:DUF2489 domain-containing protein [Paraferrimonas sp. SM1919]
MLIAVAIIGLIIIVALGAYAGHLLIKLKGQKQKQAEAHAMLKKKQQERLDYIQLSIQVIAKGITQEQCEIGEGVIRLAGLFRAAETAGIENRYKGLLPNIHELHAKINHHPILDARKQYNNKELMKFDLERMKLEIEYKQAVTNEAKLLHEFDFNKALPIGDIPVKLV